MIWPCVDKWSLLANEIFLYDSFKNFKGMNSYLVDTIM